VFQELEFVGDIEVMVTFISRYSGPHCIGIALAIAVWLGYFSSRATAECGDYVIFLNNKSAANQQVEMKPHTSTETSSDRSRPHTPCRGPNCSSNPSQETAPLAAPVSTQNESKVSTSGLNFESSADGKEGWLSVQICEESPRHIPNAVFHPPRSN
jgi:hypothetical protein